VIASAGRSLQMPRLNKANKEDASGDFVLFRVRSDSGATPSLKLASTAPAPGAPVWLVSPRGAAAGRVVLSSNKRLMVRLEERPPAGRLSGAPLINHRAEVVGIIALGGPSNTFVAVPQQALLEAAAGD